MAVSAGNVRNEHQATKGLCSTQTRRRATASKVGLRQIFRGKVQGRLFWRGRQLAARHCGHRAHGLLSMDDLDDNIDVRFHARTTIAVTFNVYAPMGGFVLREFHIAMLCAMT